MATIREILEPIVGAEALAEAERRGYNHSVFGDQYHCGAGYCVLGIILRAVSSRDGSYFPNPREFKPLGLALGPTPQRALHRLVEANDGGYLRTPGDVAELLDSQL